MDYRQIQQLKKQYPGALLFVRLGDFFEVFGQDAVTVSKELEIVLTSRQFSGEAERVNMAGVPHHSFDQYLKWLVDKGYKVAIAENEGVSLLEPPVDTAKESIPVKGLIIKSQAEGWPDWSTETLSDDARKAAEWLIKNGYGNESDVKSVFYYRQTSHMSDNYHAEEDDNAAIVRVAEKYREKEAGKSAQNNQENKNSKENRKMENNERNPIFDNDADEQAAGQDISEQKARLTPEDFLKRADADFYRAMREGKYPEIIDGIAGLDYSVRNVMLIKSQMPGAVSVGGANYWNYRRRSIIAGSKSLKILAPKFTDGGGKSGDAEKDGTEKAAGYKLNSVFDISQTQGEELKETRCDAAFLETHYEGIKNTIAAMAGEYTFIEDADRSYVDYAKKEARIKVGKSNEDILKTMLRSVANIRVEGRDRDAGNDISQGKAMFNELKETAIAHIVAKRIGLDGYKLKTVDFSEFDDEALGKFAGDLNYVKAVAHKMTGRIENYVGDVRSEERLQAEGVEDTNLDDIFDGDFNAPGSIPAPDEMENAGMGEM
jgi:DNA mismatch repair protein MutS